MLVKLALRNVRRSAKDYAIYFITLLFGVAVFYAFNSIEGQSVVFDLRERGVAQALEFTNRFLSLFSVLVALVLAFLVVYANRFIIKRRKREFGTYLLLGMTAGKMAAVLLLEMLMVGAASLAVGLVAGILLAQGLAFATAALMGTTMSHYTFLVSGQAILLTLGCFAVMFTATLAMNVVFVSRRKLGDLLTERSSVAAVSRVPLVLRAAGFLVSLGVLAVAYWLLWDNGMNELDNQFLAATVLMVVGTVLLFWSGSTAIIALLSKWDGFYLAKLHAFTSRQVSAKIGTAFASMSIVCVMLFFAVCTVTVGFGCMGIFVGNVEETTQYDMTVSTYLLGSLDFMEDSPYADYSVSSYEEAEKILRKDRGPDFARAKKYGFDMMACLSDGVPEFGDAVREYAQVDYHCAVGLTYGDILEPAGIPDPNANGDVPVYRKPVEVLGISQFNNMLALTGKDPIDLPQGSYLVNNSLAMLDETAKAMRQKGAGMTIGTTALTCADIEVSQAMRNAASLDTALEIVVPDAVIEELKQKGSFPIHSVLNAMYSCDRATGDDLFARALAKRFPLDWQEMDDVLQYNPTADYATTYQPNLWPAFGTYTGAEMAAQAGGVRLLCVYLAMYIGFVLLVTTAAVLAIQQLSETADSVGRYRRLSSIGCDRGMVLGSLRWQTALYFAVPLAVALVHAVYAVSVLNGSLFAAYGVDPTDGIVMSGVLLVAIYGCYGAVAYLASRAIVKEACGF